MKHHIFDFDGTIIKNMNIDYDELKRHIQTVLQYDGVLTPMFDKINELSTTPDMKQQCHDIIDQYELNALDSVVINSNIIEAYVNSPYKIVLSRNGHRVIHEFFKKNNIAYPDYISCRDNSAYLKPNTEQVYNVMRTFPELNCDNIVIVGDSWHDAQLAKNVGCEYTQVINGETCD